MRHAQLVCTILLISSFGTCILATPRHHRVRAAAAGHWGSETVTTEPKNIIQSDDDSVVEEINVANPVNNFPETEEEKKVADDVDTPPLVAVDEDKVVDSVTEPSVSTDSAEEEEVDTPFPNVGKIQDIIEAGNSAMLGKVDLKNVGQENVLIAREKDGDYHIHIRVPANKASGPEVPDIEDATDFAVTEATEIIPEDDDSVSTTIQNTSGPVNNWGSSPSENENSNNNNNAEETTGKPKETSNPALGNTGMWAGTTSKAETTGSSSHISTTNIKTTSNNNAETTKPELSASAPVRNWGKDTEESDNQIVSDKGKSEPEDKPETVKTEEDSPVSTSWFRYNDGTLNYLAILAVLFFLFI